MGGWTTPRELEPNGGGQMAGSEERGRCEAVLELLGRARGWLSRGDAAVGAFTFLLPVVRKGHGFWGVWAK